MKTSHLPVVCGFFSRAAGTHSGACNPKYVNSARSGKDNFEKCFQNSHVKTTLFQKALLGVGSGVISITSPSRGDMVAVMGEVTGYPAWEYIHSKMKESEEGRQILDEKPRISSVSVDLEKLKNYPEGSLGKAYSNFLTRYGYSPDTRNAVQFVDNLELAYVAQRYREAHDLFHTLLDMPTNMLGEVTVKWVEAIQLKLPMCISGALFGSVRLAPKFTRTYGTVPIVNLDSSLIQKIENKEVNPRRHPGSMSLTSVRLPGEISNSIELVLDLQNKKLLREKAKMLSRILECRAVPTESKVRETRRREMYELMRKKHPDKEDDIEFQRILSLKVEKNLKFLFYNWRRIDYDRFTSLQYLVSRAPADYAVLKRVFNEIAKRDPNFAPKTLLDFGSGVGTVTWAAHRQWGGTLKEYFCIDPSAHMNKLAALILRNNDMDAKPKIEKVYYRQFLPKTPKPFDVVVSSFTFFELENCKERLKTLTTLWNDTKEYLVLIENGTNAGFDLIIEARDYILTLSKEYNVDCYIFAPCPHEYSCPRLTAPGKKTPCNFYINYENFRFYEKEIYGKKLFSYVIFKKGKRPPEESQSSRIVREILKRHRKAICTLCTNKGELKQCTFTAAKTGKLAYRCMRLSKWGDLVPGVFEEIDKSLFKAMKNLKTIGPQSNAQVKEIEVPKLEQEKSDQEECDFDRAELISDSSDSDSDSDSDFENNCESDNENYDEKEKHITSESDADGDKIRDSENFKEKKNVESNKDIKN